MLKRALLMWGVAAIALQGSVSFADELQPGTVIRVDTRGSFIPVYAIWNENAVATVVMYSGGAGGYGQLGDDGWPVGQNFLIRATKLFAAHPFNIVLAGRAKDGLDLDNALNRLGDAHDQDNQAIFNAVKERRNLPIWLVGTSKGTISAAAAAIRQGEREGEGNIAGIVLTSSIVSYRFKGAVPSQALGKIKVPVLVVHHEKDACKACASHEVKYITNGLTSAPIKKTVLVNGGSEVSGDPCEPMHYHGYIGMEKEVVDLIAAWIKSPVN